MNCWLVFVEDCSRPCNCLSEHPLILNSNPGIIEGDGIIIVDEEARIPCCVATVDRVKFSKVNEELKIYTYLRDCSVPNEINMNEIMRIIRSMSSVSFIIKVININQRLNIKC